MKGFITQANVILFSATPSLGEVKAALEGVQVTKEVSESETWQISGPSLLVPYRPEVNGFCSIDIVDRGWPDSMGDPASDPTTYMAWVTGQFGPFTFPGALERARAQCWNWPEAESLVTRHQAFARLRHSYAFGAAEDQPMVPADCQPLDELRHAVGLASKIMNLEGAIALFNPNGECLYSLPEVEAALTRSDRTDMQELWCNVRMFSDGRGNLIFDTKGLEQVDLRDHEVVVRGGKCDEQEIVLFLRNVAAYVIGQGEVIGDGDTVDGPGGKKWKCTYRDESTLPGPRPVLSWAPVKRWFGR